MKLKMLAVLAALLLAAGLSGCFQIDEEVWHNQDGSGKFHLDVGVTEELMSYLNPSTGQTGSGISESWKQLGDAPKSNPNIKSAKVDEVTKDGMTHFTADFELVDIEKSNATSAGGGETGLGNFKVEKLTNGNYKFSQTLGANLGQDTSQDPQTLASIADALKDRYWTVRLHAANVVGTDKAAVVDPKTGVVEWKLPMAQLTNGQTTVEIWAEYKAKPDLPILLIAGAAGAVLVLVIGFGAFVMLRRRQAAAKELPAEAAIDQPAADE